MQKLHLPHVILPTEFLTLLKSNLSISTSPAPVFDVIRPNEALYYTLEKAFQEFDDGRGLEKTMLALGWGGFRDRFASLYIYKAIHGHYPIHTSMELVEDIRELESRFHQHSIHGSSRVFLLGFYLRLANIQQERRESHRYNEIKVPFEISQVLRLSQGRSEKLDWLILILIHLVHELGEKLLMNSIVSGKKLNALYPMMSSDSREQMHENLLAYAASIKEPDFFLYEKV